MGMSGYGCGYDRPLQYWEGVYVFLYIVSYITYASPLESKVWLDAVTIFQINNMQKGGFLRDNEIILIHQTTNFYATLAPKTFLRILTI